MAASTTAHSVATLRETLRKRFPGAVPLVDRTAGAVPTGIEALDRALPGSGFPRGRLAVWEPGSGVTSLLLAACQATVRRGERAAWVDGAGVAAGGAWAHGPVLARPSTERDALGCAEELVRSGGFALVILAGARAVDAARVRLTRVARESGTALVAVSEETWMASVRVRSWMPPEGVRWRRNSLGEPVQVEAITLRVRATALGWSGDAELVLPVVCDDLRLFVEPGLADRRGAAG